MKLRNIFRFSFVYLMIAIAVIVIIATILKPSPQGAQPLPPENETIEDTYDRSQGWILCAPVIFVVLAIMAVTFRKQKELSARIDQTRFEALPGQQGDIPEAKQPIVDALLERGFTRIDDLLIIPGDNSPTAAVPAFLGPSNHVMALVATLNELTKPNLALETLYADGAVLYTYHPYGVTSRSAMHEASRQGRSPMEAIEYHLQQMKTFGEKHGPIHASATPDDRAAWLATFGARHQSPFRAWFQQMGWLIPILLTAIIMSLAMTTTLLDNTLGAYLYYGSCILSIGWLVYSIVTGRLMFRR